MPTVFTHAAVGLGLAALAPWSRRPPRLWVVSAGLAMLPDLDVVALAAGLGYASMWSHRGISHSLPAAAVLGLLAAAALRGGLGVRTAPLAAFFAVVTASHGILDALTDGGLGVAFLAPFDGTRAFWPWRPIEVSPLGLAFFSPRGLRVLASEATWIWLPAAAIVGVGLMIRRSARPRA